MAELKQSLSDVQNKWGDVTPGRARYYKAGVEKNTTWQTNTEAAAEMYKDAVSAADIDVRFKAGVTKTGQAGWKKETSEKGVPIWGSRVTRAKSKYGANFGEYYSEIAALKGTEPERFPRGNPENLKRVEHYAMGLRKKWEAIKGIAT